MLRLCGNSVDIRNGFSDTRRFGRPLNIWRNACKKYIYIYILVEVSSSLEPVLLHREDMMIRVRI